MAVLGTGTVRGTVRDGHAMPAAAVVATVEGAPDGLSAAEAAARLARWGPNEIPEAAGHGMGALFVRQFAPP